MQNLSCLALVSMPLLQCYNILGTALTKFLMLGLILFFLFVGNKRPQVPKQLKYFLVYAFTIPQIFAIISGNTSEFLGSYITLILFSATFVCLMPYLSLSHIIRYYRVIVYIAIGVFVLQEVSFLVLGSRFGVLIPFLDLYTGMPASDYLEHYQSFERSCSIFVEPSHFAQYLAPYLALTLNDYSKKRRFFGIDAIIISVALLLARSGNGYFLLASIWVVHFLMCRISMLKKLCIVLPIVAFIIIYGFDYISKTDIGSEVLERTEQLDADYSGDKHSGTIRIYRGLWVYATMAPVLKVFGVGLGGVNDIIDNSPLSWSFAEDHYVNNASLFLMAFGYIGCALLLLFLVSLCSRAVPGTIYIIVAFVVLCFMESFTFDSRMLLYLLLPFALKNSDDIGAFSSLKHS